MTNYSGWRHNQAQERLRRPDRPREGGKPGKPHLLRLPGNHSSAIASATLLRKQPSGPEEARLRQVVEELAHPNSAVEAEQGAKNRLRTWSIDFGRSSSSPFLQATSSRRFLAKSRELVIGHNVGARLRGRDQVLKDECVILAAHFDHLGVRNGRLYPGADDNASGVAMMLEVARTFAESPTAAQAQPDLHRVRPRRSGLVALATSWRTARCLSNA